MNSLRSIDLKISEKLKADKEYRDSFFELWAHDEVAIQLLNLRKKRGMRQIDLAEATRTQQSAISRLEQASYSKWSFPTLLKIASALDARIKVILEPAEDVIREYERREDAVNSNGGAVSARDERLREVSGSKRTTLEGWNSLHSQRTPPTKSQTSLLKKQDNLKAHVI